MMIFINEAATAKKPLLLTESFTYSKPKTKYKDWLIKKKTCCTANYYNTGDKLQLGLFYCSQLLFILLPIILLSFQFRWILVLSLIAVRYISVWIIVGFSADKLKEDDLKFWFPIIEFIFTQINIFITNTFSKPVNWK
jgi:hypothetical protein